MAAMVTWRATERGAAAMMGPCPHLRETPGEQLAAHKWQRPVDVRRSRSHRHLRRKANYGAGPPQDRKVSLVKEPNAYESVEDRCARDAGFGRPGNRRLCQVLLLFSRWPNPEISAVAAVLEHPEKRQTD
jgi:hypothetical protein